MNAFKLFHFSLPSFREGLLLKQGDAWAEVSPLPNWSEETLSESTEQLLSLTPHSHLHPSVSFGLSCLQAPAHPPFSLPLAALFTGTPDEILEQSELALKEGYTHAKVKVGHLSLENAAYVVRALLPLFVLRIDLNRGWETDDALSFFSHFPKDAFEFVEEPLKNSKDLSSFSHPFALDETFRDHPDILKTPLPRLSTLVIKPTLTGSIPSCLAKKKGLSIIISSAYESGVGTYHLARLAKQLQSPNTAAGLGPYRTLTEDVLTEKLKIKGGRIYIPKQIHVNVLQSLREIACASDLMSTC